MPPFPSLTTCITFEEFSGERATLEELKAYLSKFKREQVVHAACVINAFLAAWAGNIDAAGHDALVREAFFQDDAEKLLQASNLATGKRYVFHRQQILLVAKLAVLHCPEEGIDPFTTPHWGGLGLAFLMASDLMSNQDLAPATRQEGLISLLSQLIAVGEYSGRYHVGNRVARAHLMFSTYFPSVAKERLDLLGTFSQITGLEQHTFIATCVGIIIFYLTHDYEKLRKSPGVIMDTAWWANVKLDKTIFSNCLNEISGTLDQIRAVFLAKDRGLFDMTGFRSLPVCRHSNGGCYAPDVRFVIEKLESGIFWKVHDSLQDKDLLHRLWGEAFAKYVNALIQEAVDQRINIFLPSPTFKQTSAQVCDGIIVCGDTAMFLEYKGRTFRADAKYNGDSALLQQEIETHLVGNADKPKGVFQLANAIKKACDPDQPMEINGLDMRRISKVIPVLLTRDDLGGVFLISHYLNLRFNETIYKRRYRPKTITPLFALSIAGMELISGYLRGFPLSSFFETWYQRDKSLYSSFLAEFDAMTKDIGDRRNINLSSVFERVMDEASATLLGGKDLTIPSSA
jgi:hypothetical protein